MKDVQQLFKEVSVNEVKHENGGNSSYACKMAWLSCVNDTALAGLGTSNPSAVCAYMKKVCK